jgi:cysteine-rich repeat protein
MDPGESCDDGNTRSDDGCTACCEYESPMMMYLLDQCDYQILVSAKPWMRVYSDCGDGIVEALLPEEECDDGNRLDGDGCSAICRWEPLVAPANCGNGVLDPGEECDDGTNNGGYGECAFGCRLGARCGDAIVQTEAGEQCDRGEQYNTGGFEGCEANCRFSPHCGDGIVQIDLGEQCDDGDANQSGYGHCSGCRLGRNR